MPGMSRRRSPASAQSAPADPAAAARPPFVDTHRGRALLCGVTVILLTLAYAPLRQFYLAWVGLVPWLVVVARARTARPVFWWSWLTGILFFALNMWWLVFVTAPGAAALIVYLGFWFVVAALVTRGVGIFRRRGVAGILGGVFLLAAIWVGTEWLRGNLFTGLPWLYLGHTQTPVLAMCQVADFASVYGVSFWVLLVNALVLMLIHHRDRWVRVIAAGVTVVGVIVAVLAYGLFRMGQETRFDGPVVMVVQPNFPQDNTGGKGASMLDLASFHIQRTREVLSTLDAQGKMPDLVVWSETMMPELNREYRQWLRTQPEGRHHDIGAFIDQVHEDLVKLCERFNTNLLTGGVAMMPDKARPGKAAWNRYNSAYLLDPSGRGAGWRYDKIHLVPFGEFIPFRESFPPLYRFFNLFNPYDADYTVTQGKELTVFAIPPRPQRSAAAASAPAEDAETPGRGSPGRVPRPRGGRGESPPPPATMRVAPYRFVTPICFEDIDSRLVARMFRGEDDSHPKQAQFIVNLTNDGWFRANEMPQHLQVAIFRSIENRAPTARSVNTGISGFIDSVGRTHDLIAAGAEGVATAKLLLDRRVTVYTRYGDLFAGGCVVIAVAAAVLGARRWMQNRRGGGR